MGYWDMSPCLSDDLMVFVFVYKEEVHSEIERVVGRSRPPCLADRVYMPYTNAVLHETQRLGNILPMNTPRVARRDTTLGGYLIPQVTGS